MSLRRSTTTLGANWLREDVERAQRQIDRDAKLARDSRRSKDAPQGRILHVIDHAHGPYNPTGPSAEDLRVALNRAEKLIDWMAGYIGNMAPGSYSDCYSDLNEHFLFMAQYGRKVEK